MRTHGIATVILLNVAAAQNVSGQVASVPRDAVDIGTATLEWYAGHTADYVRRGGATLVVSTETIERVQKAERAGDGPGLVRSARASFGFTQASLNRIRQISGAQLEICNSYKSGSLCGIAPPFLWVSLSTPLVENNRAVIFLDESEPFPNAPVGLKTLQGSLYQVDLVKKEGQWKVTNWTKVGVS